jgi:hypothetical protein
MGIHDYQINVGLQQAIPGIFFLQPLPAFDCAVIYSGVASQIILQRLENSRGFVVLCDLFTYPGELLDKWVFFALRLVLDLFTPDNLSFLPKRQALYRLSWPLYTQNQFEK